MDQKLIRRQKIAARDNLTTEERTHFSEMIAARIAASDVFKNAKTVMLYKAVRGEVSLAGLETLVKSKTLVYPFCINGSEMHALCPWDEDSWRPGRFGILEPVPERSTVVVPEEIDLVLCPCTAFDENCGRIGMGAGYYDRFLPLCKNAVVLAIAFECQKAEFIPVMPWDRKMDGVVTEAKWYFDSGD